MGSFFAVQKNARDIYFSRKMICIFVFQISIAREKNVTEKNGGRSPVNNGGHKLSHVVLDTGPQK